MKIRQRLVATTALAVAASGLFTMSAQASLDLTGYLVDHRTVQPYFVIYLDGPGVLHQKSFESGEGAHVFYDDSSPNRPGSCAFEAVDANENEVASAPFEWDGFSDVRVDLYDGVDEDHPEMTATLITPAHLTLSCHNGIANVPAGHTITVNVWSIYGSMGTIAANEGIRGFNGATNHWHGLTFGNISGQLTLVVKDGATTLKTLTYNDTSHSSLSVTLGGDYNTPSGINGTYASAAERTIPNAYMENRIAGWPSSGHTYSLAVWTKYGAVGTYGYQWPGSISGSAMLCESEVFSQVLDNGVAVGPIFDYFWTGQYDSAEITVNGGTGSYSTPSTWQLSLFEW
jgi:hypothetical protein